MLNKTNRKENEIIVFIKRLLLDIKNGNNKGINIT